MARPFLVATLLSLALPAHPCSPPTRRRRRRCSRPTPTSRWRCMATRWRKAQKLDAAVDALLRNADRRHVGGGARSLAGRPRALPADRGVPVRQPDRRRVGGPGECLAARRRPDRLCGRRDLRRQQRRERVLRRQRDRQSRSCTIGGKTIDASTIDAALLGSLHEIDEVEANVSRRLSRDRVPALGPGPERHRPRQGQPAGQRLCLGRRLHRRQLRPARGPISRRRPTCW